MKHLKNFSIFESKEEKLTKSQEMIISFKEKFGTELDEKFESTFNKLIHDENLQNSLSENMKKLGKPNATKDIVEQIVKLIK